MNQKFKQCSAKTISKRTGTTPCQGKAYKSSTIDGIPLCKTHFRDAHLGIVLNSGARMILIDGKLVLNKKEEYKK